MQVAFAGGWNELVENRPAFLSALVGSAMTCALLTLAANVVRPDATQSDRDTEIDFQPGFIARLGIDEAIGTDPGTGTTAPEAPEQPVAETPHPEPSQPSTQNTMSQEPSTKPRPKHPRGVSPLHGLPQPSEEPGKLPTAGKGNPFASPDGWSDMDQAGEPWATSVMQALAGMEVGAFAGDLEGKYKFQITICSDGSIDRVTDRGGSMDAKDRRNVKLALEQLDLPRPPASVRRMLEGKRCRQIAHVFVWSADTVK